MAKTRVLSLPERFAAVLSAKALELRAGMSAQVVAPSDQVSEARLLREVDDALLRIESGTYAICQECGEPISLKRLEASPWTTYCVSCQELVNLREPAGESPVE